MQELDLLILGAGWTSTFLIPLLQTRHINFAATTRDGRRVADYETLKWSFDPDGDSEQFSKLPLAKNVLITFPLTGKGQSKTLVSGYDKEISKGKKEAHFIQLGSTGIWQIPQSTLWTTRHSPYNASNSRAIAEDELLGLNGCVLNLAGLWGGERDARHLVPRVAKTKEDVKGKKSLHMIHGEDVARVIIAVTQKWEKAKGERWMVNDGFVYDWWSLFAQWADETFDSNGKVVKGEKDVDREPSDQAKWVWELMEEDGVRALPRSMETLGRCYDCRELWQTFQLAPLKGGLSC